MIWGYPYFWKRPYSIPITQFSGVPFQGAQWHILKCSGLFIPIGSMYGLFTYIYHKIQPNVGNYTIYGSCGIEYPATKSQASSQSFSGDGLDFSGDGLDDLQQTRGWGWLFGGRMFSACKRSPKFNSEWKPLKAMMLGR